MARYEIRVSQEEGDEYPYSLVDTRTGEVLDEYPSAVIASSRLEILRGSAPRDEYEN